MRPRLFIIIVVLLALVALGGVVVYTVWLQENPAAREVSEPSIEGPSIAIVPAAYNFGTVSPGRILQHDFAMRNAGTAVLRIEGLSTSCDCLKASLRSQTREILPGEEVVLTAILDTDQMDPAADGVVAVYTIYIESNDVDNSEAQIVLRARLAGMAATTDGSASSLSGTIMQDSASPTDSAEGDVFAPLELDLLAQEWRFVPDTITVDQGTEVLLQVESVDFDGGLAAPYFDINALLQPGRVTSVIFTADEVGSYDFYCTGSCRADHPGMVGTIVVE